MDHLALASLKLAQKYSGKAVTRCHGYDIYPREGNYVVMQRFLTKNLNRIFPIAEDGKKLFVLFLNVIHLLRIK